MTSWVVIENCYDDIDDRFIGYFENKEIYEIIPLLEGSEDHHYSHAKEYSFYNASKHHFEISKTQKKCMSISVFDDDFKFDDNIKLKLLDHNIKIDRTSDNFASVTVTDIAEIARSKLSKQEYEALKNQVLGEI